MRIKPCHGCPLKVGCEVFPFIKEQIPKETAKGFVSVAIKCGEIVKRLAPGTRIMLNMPVKTHFHSYEGHWDIKQFPYPATVTFIDAKGHFNAVMDKNELFEDDKFRFRKRANISRIKKVLNEPPRQICMRGNPIVDGKCDTQHGEECSHIDYRNDGDSP